MTMKVYRHFLSPRQQEVAVALLWRFVDGDCMVVEDAGEGDTIALIDSGWRDINGEQAELLRHMEDVLGRPKEHPHG